jgi:dienelactone hydrolase
MTSMVARFAAVAMAACGFGFMSAGAAHAQKASSVTIPAGDGRSYAAKLYAPTTAGPAPAVLVLHTFYGFVHGAAEPSDQAFGQALAKEGFVALVPNYAHASMKERPHQPGIAADLSKMVTWLSARPEVAGKPIGAVGFSIGAAHAARLASRDPNVKGVIGYYGIYNFRLRPDMQGRPNLPPSAVDVADYLNAPVLLLHGTADDETAINQATDMKAALERANKRVELISYQGAFHRFDRGRHDKMKSDKSADGYTYKVDAKARDDAFKRTVGFLRENLK